MISGSSNIQAAPESGLVSPSVKVTMRPNWYRDTRNYEDNDNFDGEASNIVAFNGDYYGIEVNGGRFRIDSDTLGITYFDFDGQPIGSFHHNGNSLSYNYRFDSGVTNVIYKVSSSDGITWGNTIILYIGNSNIRDVFAVGDSRTYFLEEYSAAGGFRPNASYLLKKVEKVGTTWGTTILYNKLITSTSFQGSYFLNSRPLNAWGSSGYDHIILNTNDNNGVSFTRGIKILKTDGVNLLKDFNLTTMGDDNFDLLTAHYTSITGDSVYMLQIGEIDIYRSATKSPNDNDQVINNAFMKTQTGNEWTTILNADFTDESFVDVVKLYNNVNQASTRGLTPDSFVFSGLDIIQFIQRPTNTIDISADISSYSNQNNERISLTLGNYK